MLRAMPVRKPVLCACALACAALAGCAYGEVRQVIRAQFAKELSCPEVTLRKRDVWYSYEGPDQYKVSGCGVIRTYSCPDGDGMASYDEPACTWVAGDADAPQLAKMEADADEGAPPAEGAASEPMDADAQLDAAEGEHAPAAADEASAEPEPAAAPTSEPAKKKPAAKAPAAKGGIKASGGIKLGGKKK